MDSARHRRRNVIFCSDCFFRRLSHDVDLRTCRPQIRARRIVVAAPVTAQPSAATSAITSLARRGALCHHALAVFPSNAIVASSPKPLDRVRWQLRAKHYSIRTEEAYVDWIRRFIVFHQKRHWRSPNRPPPRARRILLDCGYRIDLLISGELILEIKSVETLLPIHQAQILTYMRLASISTGLLINFNVSKLQNGIKRFVL